MNRIIFIVSVLTFSLGIVVGSLFFLMRHEDGQSKQASLSHIIETVRPTVVSISATSMDGSSMVSREGTGIIVQSRGLVLTSKHLISPGFAYRITLHDGTEFPATLVKNHTSRDLALFSIVSDAPLSLPVGVFINSQASIQQGDSVISIGNTLGLYPGSVAQGIISGTNRTVSFGGISMSGLIQTTLPMHLGNSGGPLISSDGNIIGINTGIVGGSSQIGWTLPVTQDEINTFLQD